MKQDEILEIVKLASLCPTTYGEAGDSFADYERNEKVIALSMAVRKAGLDNLSRAIPKGVTWAKQISLAKNERDLMLLNEDASSTGYSWMK